MATKNAPSADQCNDDLAGDVSKLADEINLLRIAIDELREELVWAVRNGRTASTSAPRDRHIASLPLDPTADDFADRVNTVDADKVAELRQDVQDSDSPLTASPVAVEELEQIPYCCDQPKLIWTGDHEYPSVVCDNCNFLVADGGEVLSYIDPETLKTNDKPQESQGTFGWCEDSDVK